MEDNSYNSISGRYRTGNTSSPSTTKAMEEKQILEKYDNKIKNARKQGGSPVFRIDLNDEDDEPPQQTRDLKSLPNKRYLFGFYWVIVIFIAKLRLKDLRNLQSINERSVSIKSFIFRTSTKVKGKEE